MANLAGWPYWKVISITGQAGAGTDYQVELEIGDSAGGDFHLEGHCTNFPQDIRITDDDGTTLLDHWVEDLTADPIVVRVEVKDDLGSNRDIRVYYGKSGETTASNISDTFIFGDDFNDGSIDGSKWNVITTTNTYIESGGVLTIKEVSDPGYTTAILSIPTFSRPFILEFDYSIKTSASMFGVHDNTNEPSYANLVYGTHHSSVSYQSVYEDGNNRGLKGSHAKDTLYSFRFDVKTTGCDYIRGGAAYYNSTYSSEDVLKAGFTISGVGSDEYYIENVRVRKYNSPEPAFSSAGAEQTPTGVSPTGVFYGPLVGPFGGPI